MNQVDIARGLRWFYIAHLITPEFIQTNWSEISLTQRHFRDWAGVLREVIFTSFSKGHYSTFLEGEKVNF